MLWQPQIELCFMVKFYLGERCGTGGCKGKALNTTDSWITSVFKGGVENKGVSGKALNTIHSRITSVS